MHTRSRGPVSPPPAPKPSKRRASASAAPTSILRHTAPSQNPIPSAISQHEPASSATEAAAVSTPRAKRVRFSDPGPSLTLSPSNSPDPEAFVSQCQNSTGLTPSLQRTRLLTPQSSRRVSFPASPSLRGIQHPFSSSGPEHIVQFTPLTSRLGSRTTRHLRRSHLSEAQNALASQQLSARRREVAALKAVEASQEAKIAELTWELESQRQLGLAVGTEEEARIQVLEAELKDLRTQLERIGEEDERRRVLEWAREGGSETELWSSFNPSDDAGFTSSIPGAGKVDEENVCRRISFGSPVVFQSGQGENRKDFGIQVEMEDASHAAEIQLFEQAVARLTAEASDARKELDRILEELKKLGLVHEDMPASDVGEGLKRLFRTARLELEYALPGETASGFEDGRLLSVLVNHVRNLKEKLTDRSNAADQASQREGALRRNFEGTLERVQHLEARLTVVDAQRQEIKAILKGKDELIHDLENAADARKSLLKQRQDTIDELQSKLQTLSEQAGREKEENEQAKASADKLKAALDSYRSEIVSLEALVTSMDDDACQLREKVEKQAKEIVALKAENSSMSAKAEQSQNSHTESAKRIAELEEQVASAQKVIFESNERLEREVKKHMNTRATLDELQDEIDRANDKASKSKRDSGAMCW